MAVWGAVAGPGGFRRELTDEDFVWAVKAVHHEVSPPPTDVERGAVLWTMLDRWVSGRYGGGSFGRWITKFSSTVNPIWTTRCRSDEPVDCLPEHYARKWGCCEVRQQWVRDNIARPFSWYARNAPDVVAYVAKFFRGGVPAGPYAGLADFAAKFVRPARDDVYWNDRIPGLPEKANAFYKEPWSLGWTRDAVRIEGALTPRPLRRAVLGLGFGVLAGGLALGVLWSRSRSGGRLTGERTPRRPGR